MGQIWRPNVVVAGIIEDAGKFLVVEETDRGRVVINQPAGHLDDNESLYDAVVREVREETQHLFEPRYIVGVYRLRLSGQGTTYLRFCFAGRSRGVDASRPLDTEIMRVGWMTRAELSACNNLRSPLVLQCVDDYVSGQQFPLSLCKDFDI